ncbi:MAG: complex I NDUFA9 subunit family protein [Deferribacterota bacterium]|nr:complex I NDUFA9 subunit family protein [Deferribacterota bacterium]
MYKRIFLTGASGFVGSYLLKGLVDSGYLVKVLSRNSSNINIKNKNCEVIQGDAINIKSYEHALNDIDVIINLIGIIREYPAKGITFDKAHIEATNNLVTLAKKAGINRFIQMSANGIEKDLSLKYNLTKYKAEEIVKNNNLDFTIFRPSVIFGAGDAFISLLSKLMKRTPLFFYFGHGKYPYQPIYVKDVVKYFINSIDNKKTIGATYPLCGPKVYTYKEILSLINKNLGFKRLLLPLPMPIIYFITRHLERFSIYPITCDQLRMLERGNICDDDSINNVINIDKNKLEDILPKIVKGV